MQVSRVSWIGRARAARQALPWALLQAHTFYSLAWGLSGVFTQTLLYRVGGSIAWSIAWSVLMAIGSVAGFLLAAALGRQADRTLLFQVGVRGIALGYLALLVLLALDAPIGFFMVVGLALWTASGFYWANRHWLDLQAVCQAGAAWFYGYQQALSIVANVVGPIVGGAIAAAFAPRLTGYVVLLMLAAAAYFAAGLIPRSGAVGGVLAGWWHFAVGHAAGRRLILAAFARGFTDWGTAKFLAPLVIFVVTGGELELGLITGASSLIAAASGWLIGRRRSVDVARWLLIVGTVWTMLAMILLGLRPTIEVAIGYSIVTALFLAGMQSAYMIHDSDVFLRLARTPAEQASLILAREVGNNVGRFIGFSIALVATIARGEAVLAPVLALVALMYIPTMLLAMPHAPAARGASVDRR